MEEKEEIIEEEAMTEAEDSHLKLRKRFEGLKSAYGGDIKSAMFQLCFENNWFYGENIISKLLADPKAATDFLEEYMMEIHGNPKYKDLNFFSQLKRENFNKLYSEDLSLLALNDEDKKNRQQIINIIGYDPFAREKDEERPGLYRDLTGLLTDSMRKDIPKQKAAIEIIRSYANIDKYQKKINQLMAMAEADPKPEGYNPEAASEMINDCLSTIAKIQTNINQTTKENGFSSGRNIGSGGRGMLSDVMTQCEELGYDKGITNYYDVATSKSMKEVADISFRAMLDQVKFGATDYAEILMEQAKIVRDAKQYMQETREAMRLLKEKLTKQELIEELANDYRRKGISEEEIDEWISREYNLYDGG